MDKSSAQAQGYCSFNRLSGLSLERSADSNIGGILFFIWGDVIPTT